MTQFMSGRLARGVEARLHNLGRPVTLLYFARSADCRSCAAQRRLLEEVVALSEKLALEIFDLQADRGEAAR